MRLSTRITLHYGYNTPNNWKNKQKIGRMSDNVSELRNNMDDKWKA